MPEAASIWNADTVLEPEFPTNRNLLEASTARNSGPLSVGNGLPPTGKSVPEVGSAWKTEMVFELVLATKAKLAFCSTGGGVMFVALMPPPQPASTNANKTAATQLNRLRRRTLEDILIRVLPTNLDLPIAWGVETPQPEVARARPFLARHILSLRSGRDVNSSLRLERCKGFVSPVCISNGADRLFMGTSKTILVNPTRCR